MWFVLLGCAGAPSVELDGAGREAWAFEAVVRGTASTSCDEVDVETPAAGSRPSGMAIASRRAWTSPPA